MKIIYYHHDNGGYWFHYGKWPCYIGYTKRDAIAKFRADYGLTGKHIKFIDSATLPNLMTCIMQLNELNT